MKTRKRSDPQATRYRVALTALGKAEKRHAAAAKAITELRRKVKGYERRLSPDRLAEIAEGTATTKAAAAARKEAWKEAERTLRTAARVAGMPDNPYPIETLGPTTLVGGRRKGRRYALVVMMPEDRCLVWDNRRGYMTGPWRHRNNPKALSKPTAEPPVQYLQAAE